MHELALGKLVAVASDKPKVAPTAIPVTSPSTAEAVIMQANLTKHHRDWTIAIVLTLHALFGAAIVFGLLFRG